MQKQNKVWGGGEGMGGVWGGISGKWRGYDDMKNEGKRTETRAKESEREGPLSQEVKFGKGGS